MIKVFIYSCLLLVFLINCKSNIPEARNKTDYSQITHYSSRSAHPISSVNFDTIRIDAGNENEMTSLLGSFLFLGDTLCFADREQSTLFLYDRDGRFLGTHLSYGRGPQEIQGIYEITALPQGGYAIINDWHLNIFDQSWGGKQQLKIWDQYGSWCFIFISKIYGVFCLWEMLFSTVSLLIFQIYRHLISFCWEFFILR